MRRLGSLWREETHPVVFTVSAALIVLLVAFTAIAPELAQHRVFEPLQAWITETLGWFMILVVALMLGLAIFLIVSPYGRLRLGPDDSRPDYGMFAWFAMLFCAGMGIGLVFWGVAEPVMLLHAPPRSVSYTVDGSGEAMNFAFHHWGPSPWAIYAVIGLGLAYFGYRHGLPMTMRSLFAPLLGTRVHGPLGDVVDILAVLATTFGVATSLGMGAIQVAAGLDYVFGIDLAEPGLIAIIVVITALATVSVTLGLDRGIKRLSHFNLILAGLLALTVVLLGPGMLLSAYLTNTGQYLLNLPDTMSFTGLIGGGEGSDFAAGWTIFYWSWWISWSPFVSMFIARVSRGRTIREFVFWVLVVPTLVSFAWFTIFGSTAVDLEVAASGQAGIAQDVLRLGEHVAMYALFDALGLAGWLTVTLSLITVLVIVVFFVTSSDSGSFVTTMIVSGGKLDPAVETRMFWAISKGAVAVVLLLAGGLQALQAGAVSTGLPFAVVLVVASISLLRGLSQDEGRPRRRRRAGGRRAGVATHHLPAGRRGRVLTNTWSASTAGVRAAGARPPQDFVRERECFTSNADHRKPSPPPSPVRAGGRCDRPQAPSRRSNRAGQVGRINRTNRTASQPVAPDALRDHPEPRPRPSRGAACPDQPDQPHRHLAGWRRRVAGCGGRSRAAAGRGLRSERRW